MHVGITILIFVMTLALILIRPRGMNEATATVIGGALMLLLRLETTAQALQTVAQGSDVLLFLLGLLILSDLEMEIGHAQEKDSRAWRED